MSTNPAGERVKGRAVAAMVAAVISAAAAGAGGYALGRRAVPPSPLAEPARGGEVVARFGGHEVARAEIERQIAAQPAPVRERLAEAAERRAFVEEHVRTLALAHRAEAKGYHREPDFVRRYAQELAARLVEKDFEAPERSRPPTDDELRAWFAEHEEELQRPERVRIALVTFDAPDAAARQRKRAAAQSALAAARSGASDPYAFGNLARLRSEDPRTRGTNGEVPPMSREELAAAFGAELAAAAFELREPGAVLPRVVDAERALHVVKLVTREPGEQPTFDAARDLLRQRVARERRTRRFEEFMDGIVRDAAIRIDEKAIAGMTVVGGAAR